MIASQQRVLIYRLGSLGDTVVALPAFHQIHNYFPGADISLLTNHPVNAKAAPLESVLGKGYFFNNIIDYPIGTRNPLLLFKLIKDIRALRVDTLIYLVSIRKLKTARATRMGLLRDKWFFKAAGIKNIIGLPENEAEYNLNVDPATGRVEWEAKRLTRRLKVLGDPPLNDERYWDLKFTADELQQADKALGAAPPHQPILAISTGTKQPANDWEESNWLNLLNQLSQTLPGWCLVIIGANAESGRANKCLEAWGGSGINLCGQTTPRVSGAILKQARLFIGHDSGPMHLAACVGTPCVAIFSARNLPGQWYPRGNFNKIIYHQTDCAGCGLQVCIVQQKKCILSITVSEVQNAVMEIAAIKE